MQRIDLERFQKLLAEVYECLGGRPPSAAAMLHWADALNSFPYHNVERVLKTWIQTKTKPPVPADITKLCGEILSDSIESRAAADKRAFEVKPEEWKGPTPFAEKCIAEMKAMLAKPKRPSKDWARKIMENPHSTELQREFARPVYEQMVKAGEWRERQPGEDFEEDIAA